MTGNALSKAEVIEAVWHTVARLAGGATIETVSPRSRIAQADYERTLEDYGRTLVVPPAEAYAGIEPTLTDPPEEGVWMVDAPFWTVEEGCSDLSIEVTVARGRHGVDVMIDDVRVP